ncbi:MAG: putative DNA binding domain-containing protein [Deltaproteobacteria bacterium]|nr:putative DNA binding domain-containing protein [Deltaproteobacteria bacterium]
MKVSGNLPTPKQLNKLLKKGEGQKLEFKRSTAELQGSMQSLCAFMNASGGIVIIGVGPDGRLIGQDVSDSTQQKVAAALARFEPPAPVQMEIIDLGKDKQVIVLRAEAGNESVPFTFEGRAYERLGTTTRKMSQSRYERLLLDRGHAKRRWENLPAEGLTIEDLDRVEILRTRELAIQQNRISPDTSHDIGDILDRLGLRVDGNLTQAAQVLYGTRLFPDYPQCLLKMGRFRGTTIIGEIVDNRQEHMNAFSMVREGMAFLERTMPLGARFPEGKIFREDRFPVPPDALREILLNAVMHRDYSDYSGYVAIVVFDDRVEIQSHGLLPQGVTLEQLSGPHRSKLRNPLIAEAFHRTGAVEVWGRGTNRAIAACERHGAAIPTFEERQGFLIVTFKATIAEEQEKIGKPPARPDQVTDHVSRQVSDKYPTSTRQVTLQDASVLQAAINPASRSDLQQSSGLRDREHFMNSVLKPLLQRGLLEMTIPNKPRSSKQKYRLTEKGRQVLESIKGDAK